ncbi:Tuberous sclerosis 2-like protein [Tieghemiomyces parasiticus]|uniref:Tuberous sclerosis 2-like protein n=1 Tax=Tieghemiomyces parasiticus TaxID=78921 RepID=A0A9W8A5Q4_9FUNG|nr:Tuberous sclerosis 2-like protein [Tieghemiomyces parasiticus]
MGEPTSPRSPRADGTPQRHPLSRQNSAASHPRPPPESAGPPAGGTSRRRQSRFFASLRDFLQPKSGARDISNLQLSAQFSNINLHATPLDGRQIARAIDNTVNSSDRRANIGALRQFIKYQPVEHIEAMWLAVEDLLYARQNVQDRHLALSFMSDLIRSQYNRLGILRTVFYGVLSRCHNWDDFPLVIRCLRQLTRDGKDLYACEHNLLPFLTWWMDCAVQCKDRYQSIATGSRQIPTHYRLIPTSVAVAPADPVPLSTSATSSAQVSPGRPPPAAQSTSSFITATLSSIFSGGSTVAPSAITTPADSAAVLPGSPAPKPVDPAVSEDLVEADEVIISVLGYIADALMANFALLHEDQLIQLLDYFDRHVTDAWRPGHVAAVVQILRAILVYGQVPKAGQATFFRLLCHLVNLTNPDNERQLTRDVLDPLAKTHYYFIGVHELSNLLRDQADRPTAPDPRLAHGALHLLYRWVWCDPEPARAAPYYAPLLRHAADLLRADTAPHPLVVNDVLSHAHHFVEACVQIVMDPVGVEDFVYRITTVEWEAVLQILDRYAACWSAPRAYSLARAPGFRLDPTATELRPLFRPATPPTPPASTDAARRSGNVPRPPVVFTPLCRPVSPAIPLVPGGLFPDDHVDDLNYLTNDLFHLVVLYLMEIAHRLPQYFPCGPFAAVLGRVCRTCYVPDEILLHIVRHYEREGQFFPTHPAWLVRLQDVILGTAWVSSVGSTATSPDTLAPRPSPVFGSDPTSAGAVVDLGQFLAKVVPYTRPDLVRHRLASLLHTTCGLAKDLALPDLCTTVVPALALYAPRETNPGVLLTLIDLARDLLGTADIPRSCFHRLVSLFKALARQPGIRTRGTDGDESGGGTLPHVHHHRHPSAGQRRLSQGSSADGFQAHRGRNATLRHRPGRRADAVRRVSSQILRAGPSLGARHIDVAGLGHPRLSPISPRTVRPARRSSPSAVDDSGGGFPDALTADFFTQGRALHPVQLLTYPYALEDLRPLPPVALRAYAAVYCLADALRTYLTTTPNARRTATLYSTLLRLVRREDRYRLEARYAAMEVLLAVRADDEYRVFLHFPERDGQEVDGPGETATVSSLRVCAADRPVYDVYGVLPGELAPPAPMSSPNPNTEGTRGGRSPAVHASSSSSSTFVTSPPSTPFSSTRRRPGQPTPAAGPRDFDFNSAVPSPVVVSKGSDDPKAGLAVDRYLRLILHVLHREPSYAVLRLLLGRLADQLQNPPLFWAHPALIRRLIDELLRFVQNYPAPAPCYDRDANLQAVATTRLRTYGASWTTHVVTASRSGRPPIAAHLEASRPHLTTMYRTATGPADTGTTATAAAPGRSTSTLSLPRPESPEPAKLAVYYYAYRLLPHFLAYRPMLRKWHYARLIACFGRGLQHILDDRVIMVCMHALQLACYDVSDDMKRELPRILSILNQSITTGSLDVYILEFLSALARMPRLRANLVPGNHLAIFSIALKYITSSNEGGASWQLRGGAGSTMDPRAMATNAPPPTSTAPAPSLHHPASTTSASASSTTAAAAANPADGATDRRPTVRTRPSPAQHALSQYVLTLAYQVIDVWFMATRLRDRPQYVQTIVRGLVGANSHPTRLDEATEMCLDMLFRYAYSNVALKPTESREVINLLLMGPQFLVERAAQVDLDLAAELRRDPELFKQGGTTGEDGEDKAPERRGPAPASSLTRLVLSTPAADYSNVRTWVQGNGIITLVASKFTPWVHVTIRRPSGVAALVVHLNNELKDFLEEEPPSDVAGGADGQSSLHALSPQTDVASLLLAHWNMKSDDVSRYLQSMVHLAADSAPESVDPNSAPVSPDLRSLAIGDDDTLAPLEGTSGAPQQTLVPPTASSRRRGYSTSQADRGPLVATRHHRSGSAGGSHLLPSEDPLNAGLYRSKSDPQQPGPGRRRRSTLSEILNRPVHLSSLPEVPDALHEIINHHNPHYVPPATHPQHPLHQLQQATGATSRDFHQSRSGAGSVTGGSSGGGATPTGATRPLSPTNNLPTTLGHLLPGKPAASITAPEQQLHDPRFLFGQLSSYPEISRIQPLTPVPDTEDFARYLRNLDYVAVIDFHKIGVIYVGPGQTDEAEILRNTSCPARFWQLLGRLGTLFALRGCKDIYTGGLDTSEYETDGEFAVYWKEDITQVVFHVTPLMPTNLERDPQCTLKKRHVGNEHVRIVYNESGAPYRFDTIPGEFNSVNIVIEPLPHRRVDPPGKSRTTSGTTAPPKPEATLNPTSSTAAATPADAVVADNQSCSSGRSSTCSSTSLSTSEADEGADDGGDPTGGNVTAGSDKMDLRPQYRVYLQRRPDMPEFSPITEPKILTEEGVAPFVRQVAMHANVFTQVFLQSGVMNGTEYVSNWRERLRQIRTIKERALASHASSSTSATSGGGANEDGLGSAGQSVAASPRTPNDRRGDLSLQQQQNQQQPPHYPASATAMGSAGAEGTGDGGSGGGPTGLLPAERALDFTRYLR